ncbi:ATP-binding protein [Actinomadura sp. K4S16]|uniref:ATP-binding protein n=1 Tax=Actinomadura sp. K4S16 TaxID=1316147 RepID=UPI0011EF2F3F|nr:ATP-binding protein [Actinomadura sp. K4S16]
MLTTPDCLLLSMPASKAAPGLARTLTMARLRKWGCAHISDDAFLIAPELITNAVVATPGEEIRYQCSRDVAGVLIAVWDASPARPRGLPIVAALAAECGYSPDPTGGKWVWARLKP